MEPAGGRLSDYFTAAARRGVVPPNAKHPWYLQEGVFGVCAKVARVTSE